MNEKQLENFYKRYAALTQEYEGEVTPQTMKFATLASDLLTALSNTKTQLENLKEELDG